MKNAFDAPSDRLGETEHRRARTLSSEKQEIAYRSGGDIPDNFFHEDIVEEDGNCHRLA